MSEAELWAEIARIKGQMGGIRSDTLRAKDNPDRTIRAFYNSNAGNVIAHNTVTIFNFEDKVEDTHNCVTVGAAWKFTSPVSSGYIVSCGILWQTNAGWEAGERLGLLLYQGGAAIALLDLDNNIAANEVAFCGGSAPVYLKTNEYIDLRVYQDSDGDLTADTTATYVWCRIIQTRFI